MRFVSILIDIYTIEVSIPRSNAPLFSTACVHLFESLTILTLHLDHSIVPHHLKIHSNCYFDYCFCNVNAHRVNVTRNAIVK